MLALITLANTQRNEELRDMGTTKTTKDGRLAPGWGDKGNPASGYTSKSERPANLGGLLVDSVYRDLLDLIRGSGLTVTPDTSGSWCGLKISKPINLELEGLDATYLDETDTVRPCKIFRELKPSVNEDLDLVASVLSVAPNVKDKQYVKYWSELVEQILTAQSNRRTKAYQISAGRASEHKPTISWLGEGPAEQLVPQRHWFPKAVQALKAEDLLTLFPPAEQKGLLLMLGRVAAGVRGDVTIEGIEVEHYYRSLTILQGPPGLGKSLLMQWIISAFSSIGYDMTPWDTKNSKFGVLEAIVKAITFCDDVEDLNVLLKYEGLKQLVTGGVGRFERKGIEHEQAQIRAVFCALMNEVKPSSKLLEPGLYDRLNVLTTLSEYEILESGQDLRPLIVWNKLAKELATNINVLALWLIRLGFEVFIEATGYDPLTFEKGQDNLEDTVEALKENYSYQIDLGHVKHLVQGVAKLLAVGLAYEDENNAKLLVKAAQEMTFSSSLLIPYLKMVSTIDSWNMELEPLRAKGLVLDQMQSLETALGEYDSKVRVQPPAKLFQTYTEHLCSSSGVAYPTWVGQYQQHWCSERQKLFLYMEKFRQVIREMGVNYSMIQVVRSAYREITDILVAHNAKASPVVIPTLLDF